MSETRAFPEEMQQFFIAQPTCLKSKWPRKRYARGRDKPNVDARPAIIAAAKQ